MAGFFFVTGIFMFLLLRMFLLLTISVNALIIGCGVSLACLLIGPIIHLTRRSQFLIGKDKSGHIHVHPRSQPMLDATMVLEVNAGFFRRKCRLHSGLPCDWKVTADNTHMYFTDVAGETIPVCYCELPHHDATGYISFVNPLLPTTFSLLTHVTLVADIQHKALQQVQSEAEESPTIAGSIPATQG
ncbi:MAG: hypothetical protein A3E37_00845 [Candidatus Andersenbacteria bacterium RIFCSPHIGHO2_12_FULL_46_9]|nr:MAG: hypothetical protein A3E37_00845 [Candidatus Andersenbacteria bacterium RIFCSPHIGHO2_12_FULL_46_9]OGY35876.1 MAG: hypothetical protein A3B76_00725 [Candidatus Andersenbacteria bacterium RIFCSPHIGHO2_02_FULL_46_16]OGY37437.1 MAG: hypothetical protein A3I08_00130 [Candidatus Andersenbacteria bacterium RIFCSPLOWO2_02_FULL_46_11]HBE90934.1 hypothetical protein [Candidatus Andersenbacteria bacterium]